MGPDPVQGHVISSIDEFRLLSGPLAQRGGDGFDFVWPLGHVHADDV